MQRGKFSHQTPNDAKVGSTEVLSMIQHGAQEIIRTCNEEDEDIKKNIDKIIEQSMKKTEEMESKLNNDIGKRFGLDRVSLTGDDQEQGKTVIY